MNFTNPIKTAAALASVTVFAVCAPAQDDAAAEKPAEQPAAEQAAAEETAELAPAKATERFFYPLLRCKRAVGSVQILRPTTKDWVDAEEGRYYPLGSQVRIAGTDAAAPEAVFEFGEKSLLKVTSNAEFATAPIKIGDRVRTLQLKKGRVSLALPLQLKEGLFKVEAPYFTCENLAGESRFDYSAAGDGDEAVVRCVTGSMALNGKHFKFPRLVAANQLRITTMGDNLYTSLVGESGDCKAQLDQGILAERNFETDEMVETKKTLDFSLSPQCSIKIFRAKSKVSGRMAVSMMTFDPAGVMKNRVAFAEGRANVNSGELVVSTKVADADKKAAATKVDEETEAVEVPAPKKAAKADDDEPAPAPKKAAKDDDDEPAPAPKKDEKKDEKKDDDDFI